MLGRNGTANTATGCAASGKVTAARLRELATRLSGRAISTSERAAALREHQLHHVPRRLLARRFGELQPKAQRGQRRGNGDGADENLSWNCGGEGPTDDPDIVTCANGEAQLLATLLLSQGVAMSVRATSWAKRSTAITTPIAKTTSSPGSIGG